MRSFVAAAVAAVLCVSVGILFAFHRVDASREAEFERDFRVQQAARIQGEVVAKIVESVAVARTMAADDFLIDTLRREESRTLDESVSIIQPYLKRLRDSFSYAAACVISERTHRYYRDDEMHKIIDPDRDPHDTWFRQFRDFGEEFSVNVYRDRKNEANTRMFVNFTVRDGGDFLGVVSTSVYLLDAIEVIDAFEEELGVRVNLVDRDGLVVLDSSLKNVENSTLPNLVPEGGEMGGYRYVPQGARGYAVTKYIESLDWYFVLRGTAGKDGSTRRDRFPAAAACTLLAALVAVYALYLAFPVRSRGRRQSDRSSQTDWLTGLPNRNYFKEMYGERGVFNTTRYKTIAVFDIDFFKEANDSMNGDKALLSVVNRIRGLLDGRGSVLRWGGDEFLMLLELPMESAFKLCRQFCREVEGDGLVTVSVGLVEVRLSDTIKKNYYRAAQCCYIVKEMGGNGVKKE